MLAAELIKKARKAYEDGKAILDLAVKEKRENTTEEQTRCDAFLDEADRMKKEADVLHARSTRASGLETYFNTPVNRLPQGDGGDHQAPSGGGAPEVRTLFPSDLESETKEEKEARQAFHRKLVVAHLRGRAHRLADKEQRALSSLIDADGGYLVPEQMMSRIIVKLRDITKIRQVATTIPTSAASISFPTEDYDPDAPPTKESGAVTIEDIKAWLGKTRFTPHARKRIFKIPRELLEDAAFDLESYLVNRFAVRFKELEENDFINGDGVEKPLGIAQVTLNQQDAATSGHVIVPQDIIDTVYAIKEQYRSSASCAWLMHRLVVKLVRSLRDGSGGAGTGQLMWGPPIAAGAPQTLHGFPLMETEFLADPAATGNPWWIFGDWSYYWIVDRVQMQSQRLDELYAANDQIGILMRKRYDGAPVLKDPFYRVNRKA